MKPVTAVLDAPPLPEALRRFVDWVAGYTLAFPGEVLAMALRVNALTPETPAAGWRWADVAGGRGTRRAGTGGGGAGGWAAADTADLARAAGVSAGVVRGMAAPGC